MTYEEKYKAATACIDEPGNFGIRTQTYTAEFARRRAAAIAKGKKMDADRDARYTAWLDAGAPHQVALNAAERGMDLPDDFKGVPGSKRYERMVSVN